MSEPESAADTESFVLLEAAMHLDARHFPVLMVTWFGKANPELVEYYGDWLERMGARAAVAATQLVVLGDTTALEERPGPEVRRAMARAMDRMQARFPGRVAGVTTVISSPVMRAVITMVLAITRHKLDVKPVKDLSEGFARTLALLEVAGIPRPAGFDEASYQRPERPRRP